MSFAIVNSGAAHTKIGGDGGADPNTVTTPAIDTTGADLIVINVGTYASTATISDSKGITWSALTQQTSVVNISGQLFYAWTGSTGWAVGSGHTFTVTARFPGLTVIAFSGARTSSNPFNAENGANNTGVSVISPGSVTPAGTDLFVTGLGYQTFNTMSVGSSFSITDEMSFLVNKNVGGVMAWKESASAENPQWSWTGANDVGATIASFVAAPAGAAAAGLNSRLPVLGVS